jgi:phage terminase small subunit
LKVFILQFGLTPLSRRRLTVDERRQDNDDDLNKLISGPRLTEEERRRLKGQ